MTSLILHNGRVQSEGYHGATALVARDGVIVFVGSSAEALTHRSPETRVVDCHGAVIAPGFIDGHGHIFGLGKKLSTLALHDCHSPEEVAERVAAWITVHGADAWVVGMGWNQERWAQREFPAKELLDRVAPRTPVYLTRIDGHAAWVNSEGLRRAGLSTLMEITGGVMIDDGAGEPSGVLIDNAMAPALAALPRETDASRAAALKSAVASLHSHGITMVHDMDVDPAVLPALQSVLHDPATSLRVSSWLRGQNFEWRSIAPAGAAPLRQAFNDHLLRIDGVKCYVDGALGSRGAWLSQPYADAPATSGLPMLRADELRDRIDAALTDGFSIALHAIGDAAVREGLDGFERARSRFAESVMRIEHAQVIAPGDVSRFRDLGVLASVQPLQRSSDSPWLGDRLGPRAAWTFPFRSLLHDGVELIGGSDFPIEEPDCIAGIAAAVQHPTEGLTQEIATHLFTTWGGRGTSFAGQVGRIAPGMIADCALLSEAVGHSRCAILGTVVHGSVVLNTVDDRA